VKPVKNTDLMLERPSSSKIAASVTYGILAFFSLPFILLLLLQGSFDNEEVVVGVEMAYHVINFLATLCIFHAFLKESFWNVESNVKHFAKTVACRAYQKTDTVWAPIGVLAAVNLVTGCAFALMRVLM